MDEDKDNIEKLAEHLIRMEYKVSRRKRQKNNTQKVNARKKDKTCYGEKSSK